MNIQIRHERLDEHFEVESLVREAFWDVYKPGCDEHFLTHILRNHPDYLPELSFVAEVDGSLGGMIQYTRSVIQKADGSRLAVAIFGPLAVSPEFQKYGIGGQLVRQTIELAQKAGFAGIVIYGNPAYYSRFGFEAAERYQLTDQDGRVFPEFQLLPLQPEVDFSGRFVASEVFTLDKAQVAEFDRRFPLKEKHVLSTQIFTE